MFNLDTREARAVLQDWHDAFTPPGELRRRGASDQFSWHVFSFGIVASLSGARAVSEYQRAAHDHR